MFEISSELPQDGPAIEVLLDHAFGPDRFAKASYRLRENVLPLNHFAFVAREADHLVGTIRFWPITVVDLLRGTQETALLLGPIATANVVRGQGCGAQLMQHALSHVEKAGQHRIFLVGDIAYYGRFGFCPVLPNYITLPGGRDAHRLLVRQAATLLPLPVLGRIDKCITESENSATNITVGTA